MTRIKGGPNTTGAVPNHPDRINMTLPRHITDEVERLAAADHRSRANYCELLVIRAIEAMIHDTKETQ